jgi:hypothetical protein
MNDEPPMPLLGSNEKKFIPKSVFDQAVSQGRCCVNTSDSQKQR